MTMPSCKLSRRSLSRWCLRIFIGHYNCYRYPQYAVSGVTSRAILEVFLDLLEARISVIATQYERSSHPAQRMCESGGPLRYYEKGFLEVEAGQRQLSVTCSSLNHHDAYATTNIAASNWVLSISPGEHQ